MDLILPLDLSLPVVFLACSAAILHLLAVPQKMAKLNFGLRIFVLALLSFPQVIGSNVVWPPTKKAFPLLCYCLSPYLAPFFFHRIYSCLKLCMDLYPHTSHTPARVLLKAETVCSLLCSQDLA